MYIQAKHSPYTVNKSNGRGVLVRCGGRVRQIAVSLRLAWSLIIVSTRPSRAM